LCSATGEIVALDEVAATTGDGSTLSIGGSTLSLPALRGGTQAGEADYVECADVCNASSCVAYNATNWPLSGASAAMHLSSPAAGGQRIDATAVEYKPETTTAARVEVSVFDWAADAGRLGPF
jgi:hypothetical protein